MGLLQCRHCPAFPFFDFEGQLTDWVFFGGEWSVTFSPKILRLRKFFCRFLRLSCPAAVKAYFFSEALRFFRRPPRLQAWLQYLWPRQQCSQYLKCWPHWGHTFSMPSIANHLLFRFIITFLHEVNLFGWPLMRRHQKGDQKSMKGPKTCQFRWGEGLKRWPEISKKWRSYL